MAIKCKDLEGRVILEARTYARRYFEHIARKYDAVFVHMSMSGKSQSDHARILRKYFQKGCLISRLPHHRGACNLTVATDGFGGRTLIRAGRHMHQEPHLLAGGLGRCESGIKPGKFSVYHTSIGGDQRGEGDCIESYHYQLRSQRLRGIVSSTREGIDKCLMIRGAIQELRVKKLRRIGKKTAIRPITSV